MWAVAFEVKKKRRGKGKHSHHLARWNVINFVKGTWVFWGHELLEWTESSPWSSINLKSIGRGVEGKRLIYVSRRQMGLSGLHSSGINFQGQKGM